MASDRMLAEYYAQEADRLSTEVGALRQQNDTLAESVRVLAETAIEANRRAETAERFLVVGIARFLERDRDRWRRRAKAMLGRLRAIRARWREANRDIEEFQDLHLAQFALTQQAERERDAALALARLSEVLTEAADWADTVFQTTVQARAHHLAREASELLAAIEHDACGSMVAGEIADVQILLAHLARAANIDLAAAVEAKLAVLRQRQWGEPDAEGVVEHVREDGDEGEGEQRGADCTVGTAASQ